MENSRIIQYIIDRNYKLIVSFLLVFLTGNISGDAQSIHYFKNDIGHQMMERWNVLIPSDSIIIHNGIQGFQRRDIIDYAHRIKNLKLLDKQDQTLANFILKNNRVYDETRTDSLNRGFLKTFYRSPHFLAHIESDHFKCYVNPILNLSIGEEDDLTDFQWTNTRGIQLYGLIDDKIYFYTDLVENQGNFVNYIDRRIGEDKAIPGYNLFIGFNSSVSNKLKGYDYPLATAYIGLPLSQHVSIEMGHGNHFIGHGHHSLLLNDYASNYFYLKLDTRVWKFHYQNIFAELSPISTFIATGDQVLPKKYFAAHYLSFKPSKNIEVGLFESVVYGRENRFEFHYLNPVILLRSAEFYLDSSDNAMIGFNAQFRLWKKISLYGQFVLDELRFGELFSSEKWWGNKFGLQTGIFYPNAAGISNLDLRVEANLVRPYTYSHRESLDSFPNFAVANYSHYNQPLAHPLGANFVEFLVNAKYRINGKWFFQAHAAYSQQGLSEDFNAGDNILIPNITRVSEYGIDLLQGEKNTIKSILLKTSYMFRANYFVDFTWLYRTESQRNINTNYLGIGFRSNLGVKNVDY